MKKSITIKMPELEILELPDEQIIELVKKHKRITVPQIQTEFKISKSQIIYILDKMVLAERISRKICLVRLKDGTQFRRMYVYEVVKK